MRDVFEQILGWAVVVGIVLAIFLGRKRGQASRAAAVAAAHAQGYAEGGAAAAEAHAHQTVQVAVDASGRRLDPGRSAESVEAGTADPVLGVLRSERSARALDGERRVIDYDDFDYDYDARRYSPDDRAAPVGRVPVGWDRTGAVPSRLLNGGADLPRVYPDEEERR